MAHQFSDDERKRLARQGKAMPDGGYPIRNREDLVNAVRAYGRGNNKEEVKKWIKKRAKELDAEQYLPDNWRTDDTVIHQDIDEEVYGMPYYNDYLAHHGVKGMKWGIRRYQNKDGSLTAAGKKRQEKTRKKEARKYAAKLRKGFVSIHNAAADKNNARLAALNKEYDGVDFKKDRKAYRKYIERYVKDWQDDLMSEVIAQVGMPPEGVTTDNIMAFLPSGLTTQNAEDLYKSFYEE